GGWLNRATPATRAHSMPCTSTDAVERAGAREGSGYTHSTVKVATAFVVEPMRVEHIPAVSAIEKLSFPQPWPQNAYRREIVENRMAHYVIARRLTHTSDTEPSASEASNPHASQSSDLIGRLSRLLRPPDPPRSPQ